MRKWVAAKCKKQHVEHKQKWLPGIGRYLAQDQYIFETYVKCMNNSRFFTSFDLPPNTKQKSTRFVFRHFRQSLVRVRNLHPRLSMDLQEDPHCSFGALAFTNNVTCFAQKGFSQRACNISTAKFWFCQIAHNLVTAPLAHVIIRNSFATSINR